MLNSFNKIVMFPRYVYNYFFYKYYWMNYIYSDLQRPISKNKVNVYYWKGNYGDNVGDLLSKVIVEFMVEKFQLNNDKNLKKTIRLFAIGSVIDSARCNMVVWGSGIHHKGARIPRVKFDIRAVRGPLTRKALISSNVYCPEVYGDPALLLPLFYAPKLDKKHDFTIIPHFSKENYYLNMYKNSTMSTKTSDWKGFVNRIIESKLVISGSLHGIIIADAYGVPAVQLSDIDTDWFKYEDYYLSTGRSEVVKVPTVEQALNIKSNGLSISVLKNIQDSLVESFPKDLWSL